MKARAASLDCEPLAADDFAGRRMLCFAGGTAAACWFQPALSGTSGAVQPFVDMFALAAIAIAIWHGAYDGVLARPLFERRLGKWWMSAFAAAYLLPVAAVLTAWHFAPECALVTFLAYSSWHFGTEKYLGPVNLTTSVTAFSMGALPIAAACHWHPDQVREIFQWMLGSAAGSLFAQHAIHVCGSLLWPLTLVAAAGACVWLGERSQTTRLLLLPQIALELLLFRCCDPVLGFAIYFCLWHTPEHLVSSSVDRAGRYSTRIMLHNLRAGIIPWIAALAGLALAVAFTPGTLAGYASAIFILLSALTVPHMALNELRRFPAINHQSRSA
jgi:Brp/Blh family beta-carotene 15,15'-monooxygenase